MLWILVTSALAGVLATADDGRRVLLNDDGTWEDAPPAQAGDCAALVKDDMDPTSGKRLITATQPFALTATVSSGADFALYSDPATGAVTWSFVTSGIRPACVMPDNTLVATFTDGKDLTFKNGLGRNCDGAFAVGMTRDHLGLAALATRDLQSLRLLIRDTTLQMAVPADQATRIRQTAACLKDG